MRAMEGTYDLSLVFASGLLAVIAAYAALDLGRRIAFFDGMRERLWLGAGALALGSGIWVMHVLGMQALGLPLTLSYDLPLSLVCWMASVLMSLAALTIVSRSPAGTAGVAGGGVVLGVGICLVHYSGMYALRLSPRIGYDSELFSASIFIAVVFSIAALGIGFSVRRLPLTPFVPAKLLGALLLGIAICATHYTGMAAAKFPAGMTVAPGNQLSTGWIDLLVWLFSAGMILAVALLSMLDARKLKARRRVQWERLDARFRRGLASG